MISHVDEDKRSKTSLHVPVEKVMQQSRQNKIMRLSPATFGQNYFMRVQLQLIKIVLTFR